MIDHTRRGLLRGAGALFICAPAIVRASSLDATRGVPLVIRAIDLPDWKDGWVLIKWTWHPCTRLRSGAWSGNVDGQWELTIKDRP